MFNKYFSLLFDKSRQYKRRVAGLTGILILGAFIGLGFISFENNLELMLPENEEVIRSIRFLRESEFSDKIILSLRLEASPDHTSSDLILQADRLAESLKPPLVTSVMSKVSGSDAVAEMLSFLKYAPQMLDEKAFSRIEKEITPEHVKAKLRENYRQLLTPASTFTAPFIRSDPLGIKANILQSLQKLSASMGYEVTIENGHLISRDGNHAMLILDTRVPLTDGFGSRELISYLREQLKALPPYISADIIAGHLHTISNEDVIKRDIRLTMIIASAGFLFLFLFFFRDIRAVLIFIMPMIAVLIAVNLSALVFRNPSYFIVGMGAVIAGIAIDYGIHVYIAVRTLGSESVKHIAKPVIISALTTMSVFGAFFFSDVRGYHQLAFFAILSIILCLGGALFLLPHLLDAGCEILIAGSSPLQRGAGGDFCHSPFLSQGKSPRPPLRKGEMASGIRHPVLIWSVLMVAAAFLSFQVRFNSDVRQFDGSEPEILDAEQRFYQVWGGKESPAIFVAPGKSFEDAMRLNEQIYQDAVEAIGKDNFSSFASVWLSQKTRTANAGRWKHFWQEGRELRLKQLLAEYGEPFNFSEDAFSPFFDQLYAGEQGNPERFTFFSKLKERFVLKKGSGGYQIVSFFPDKDDYVTALEAVSSQYPGTFIVSRNALSHALSRSVSSEILFLSAIAATLIPALTCLLLRNLRLALLALIPVVTGVMTSLAIIPLAGLSLNAPSLFAAMVVVGLCIDYGIFMVYACLYEINTGTRLAVSLSAISTLIGAGVLLFANHPVMFSVGITLTSGVLSGYLASLTVLPALFGRNRGIFKIST